MPTLHYTFLDRDKESSGFSVSSPGQLSPLNVENYDVATPLSDGKALTDAIKALTTLTLWRASASDTQPIDGKVYPVDDNAEREVKLLISYVDDTFDRTHNAELPGYNNVGLLPGTDEVDLTDPDIAEFITRFEFYPGPDGGNRTVIGMRKVHRNI